VKPDFHRAMKTEPAKEFFANFVNKVKTMYVADRVKSLLMFLLKDGLFIVGEFGAYMNVSLVNNGPVTIIIDSREGLHFCFFLMFCYRF
jgi:D-tyrosyl-tRNA(Tyr) deacylase